MELVIRGWGPIILRLRSGESQNTLGQNVSELIENLLPALEPKLLNLLFFFSPVQDIRD